MTLDRYRPGTGQQIADVLQLPDQLNEPSVSSPMVRLAVRQASDALAASDWRSLWNRKRTAAHAGALLFHPARSRRVCGRGAPKPARLSLARWLFGSSERWPQRTYLTVVGLDSRGRIIAPRDERFFVEVRSDLPDVESKDDRWIIHGRGEPLVLKSKPTSTTPASVSIRERTAEGPSREGVMVATESARFQYEFPPSPSSSTFKLEGGDDWVGPLRLVRVDRPSLAGIKLRVKEPGASPATTFGTSTTLDST